MPRKYVPHGIFSLVLIAFMNEAHRWLVVYLLMKVESKCVTARMETAWLCVYCQTEKLWKCVNATERVNISLSIYIIFEGPGLLPPDYIHIFECILSEWLYGYCHKSPVSKRLEVEFHPGTMSLRSFTKKRSEDIELVIFICICLLSYLTLNN